MSIVGTVNVGDANGYTQPTCRTGSMTSRTGLRPDRSSARTTAAASDLAHGGGGPQGQRARLVDASLAQDGARRQHFTVLTSLSEQGPTSQAELGRRLSIDRSDLHALLGELERDGIVTRVRDERDRRRNVVMLTRAGRASWPGSTCGSTPPRTPSSNRCPLVSAVSSAGFCRSSSAQADQRAFPQGAGPPREAVQRRAVTGCGWAAGRDGASRVRCRAAARHRPARGAAGTQSGRSYCAARRWPIWPVRHEPRDPAAAARPCVHSR